MATLKKIWVNSTDGRHELRLDWDNERHQAIVMRTLEADDVKQALLEAAHMVAAEQLGKHL